MFSTTSAASRWEIRVLEGPGAGQTQQVGDELLIGRAASGFGRLGGDERLSRTHTLIGCGEDGAVWVKDLGSTNGTWINERRISIARALQPGDKIRVGGSILELRRGGGASRSSPVAHGQGIQTTAASPPYGRPNTPSLGYLLYAGQRVAIPPNGLTIGRGPDNEIVVPQAGVSRKHAIVTLGTSGFFIRDEGSANGTRVNGSQIGTAPRPLRHGDEIAVGDQTLRFIVDDTTHVSRAAHP